MRTPAPALPRLNRSGPVEQRNGVLEVGPDHADRPGPQLIPVAGGPVSRQTVGQPIEQIVEVARSRGVEPPGQVGRCGIVRLGSDPNVTCRLRLVGLAAQLPGSDLQHRGAHFVDQPPPADPPDRRGGLQIDLESFVMPQTGRLNHLRDGARSPQRETPGLHCLPQPGVPGSQIHHIADQPDRGAGGDSQRGGDLHRQVFVHQPGAVRPDPDRTRPRQIELGRLVPLHLAGKVEHRLRLGSLSSGLHRGRLPKPHHGRRPGLHRHLHETKSGRRP